MTGHRAILLAAILLAFSLRVWQLPQTPPGLWYDEAYNANDALWMAGTGRYPLFFTGNNGREPMWPYLLLLSISLLGNTTFAVRWVGVVAGLLTIPIIYRFAFELLHPFAQNNYHRRWLALAAAGWLAVSWWHLLNSRAGFRPVLLPPLLMFSLYFFWRGWKLSVNYQVSGFRFQVLRLTQPPIRDFILAGFFLGLSQYTYLPARLAPLIFGGLAIVWPLRVFGTNKKNRSSPLASPGFAVQPSAIRQLWPGLLVTILTAAAIFSPLALYFLKNPASFFSRTGDVAFTPTGPGELVTHLLQGVTLFLGAGHELYRHHLPGRAMLGWLEIPFFWLGLVWLLRPARLRYAETRLILLGLGVMWLPALLASPPVHSLRPIGLLPFYYLIVTLGLYQVSGVGYQVSGVRLAREKVAQTLQTTQYAIRNTSYVSRLTFHVLRFTPAIVITLNGLINTYDYFRRWANHPEVYQEYNGPLVDLTRHLISLTQTSDVIIPFHVYVHPTTRYMLWPDFPEVAGRPPLTGRPVEILLVPSAFQLLYVGSIPESPAMVLLTKDETGRGAAYVSRPPRAAEQAELNRLLASAEARARPFQDKLGRTVAQSISLSRQNNQLIQNLFDPTPLRAISLNWADLAELNGYEVTPELVRPGQPITLNLYWRSLTDTAFEYRLFLQLIDGAGNPVNQWEGDAFREDMYRWRPNGILPTQYILWPGPGASPGPYLVRMGFFDDSSGQRLPLQIGQTAARQTSQAANGETGDSTQHATRNTYLDQVQLGLFYVSPDGSDPRQPATPLSATFADSIKLIGVTLPQNSVSILQSKIQNPKSEIEVTFHWQSLRPTGKPYTVFLQLINEQGEVVSSWDSQPFSGLYPTNLWSPGEIIADTFRLPLPEGGLVSGSYRLVTGFYDFDTGQRLSVTGAGDFASLAEFVVDTP